MMEPRPEADNTGPPSDMPDIGSEPCKPCRPRRSFGKKNIVYHSFQAAQFDRWRYGGYTMTVPEMWRFVSLTKKQSRQGK